MVTEVFIVIAICLVASVLITLALRFVLGKTLTYKFFLILTPGIIFLVTDIYVWGCIGGVKNVLATITIVPIGMSLMIANFIYLGNTTIARINKVVNVLKDIAEGEGDLKRRIPVSGQDEIGDLARWFNVFADKIQATVRTIADNSDVLNAASSELAMLSEKMSNASDHISVKSNTVSTSAEEMSSTFNTVTAAMEESTTNIAMVSAAIEQLSSTLNEISQNTGKTRSETEDAVHRVNNASEDIEELGRASIEIGKVTETITEISEQTNLLALNATIEAARAGEAGKGFAVVAYEIKELARQTAAATQEIKGRIQANQDSATNTVSKINSITQIINNVNEMVSQIATSVEEQSITIKDIASNLSQASGGIQEVNWNVAQCSSVSECIAQDISIVNQSIEDISTSSAQMNLSAKKMDALAGQLQELVGNFKI